MIVPLVSWKENVKKRRKKRIDLESGSNLFKKYLDLFGREINIKQNALYKNRLSRLSLRLTLSLFCSFEVFVTKLGSSTFIPEARMQFLSSTTTF